MKTTFFSLCLAIASLSAMAQWQPAGDRILTPWGEELTAENVWNVYPRPLMERSEWMNLNGLWQYAVKPSAQAAPKTYEGQILVPFAIESALSGVGLKLVQGESLWYSRTFTVPSRWNGKDVLLHFGAVDWACEVWVNGVFAGSHTGGYTPFCFNISEALQKGTNTLTVKVTDPTDKGFQPRGKQVSNPGGIWYTSVTGIWQTVWLEPVAKVHIENLMITPDIDRGRLYIDAALNACCGGLIEVAVYDGESKVAASSSLSGQKIIVEMPEGFKLWSPDSPYLYTLKVSLKSAGKTVDMVDSYAAMRKYSIVRDSKGIARLALNNEQLFQYGPLDQGWWPDGLYTAPSDDALRFDIEQTKAFGFNMIRKHVKVEPARWYTWCDRLGIIVWQDMPSGDRTKDWQGHNYYIGEELMRSEESEANYRKEWKEIIDYLYSNPCVGCWVTFNEAWGQFKTTEIAAWTKKYDPTRHVNPASGGNFFTCGDILDLHNYPAPAMYLFDAQRVNVLGEYGGIGMVCDGHVWEPNRNWGYIKFSSQEEVTAEYVKYASQLKEMVSQGFSAAVYTQTTDVEVEVNGLMTYDRKVVKINVPEVRKINLEVCNSLKSLAGYIK